MPNGAAAASASITISRSIGIATPSRTASGAARWKPVHCQHGRNLCRRRAHRRAYRTRRSLDRRLFENLLAGDWISRHENLAIIGPTGIGKRWLACAIGHKACRDNRSDLDTRLPRLIDELMLAKGDGRIAARMKASPGSSY
jgi:hypothetical protein